MPELHNFRDSLEPQGRSSHSKDLQASIHFLPRDPLFAREKPYSIQYEPHGDIPRTNVYQDTVQDITIHDIRDAKDSLHFDSDGFIIRKLQSELKYDAFADANLVEKVFVAEVCELLQREFKTKNVAILEFLVRRRHPSFPVWTGVDFEFAQPVGTAHIDFSPDCVQEILEDRYASVAPDIMQHHYQVINVWKPLVGPLQDWPLSVCHAASLDPKHDFELMDRVYPQNVEESIQIHYADRQRWCYLRDQMPDELLIFRVADSKLGIGAGIPHASFQNLTSPEDQVPRESIEVRALVVYADGDLSLGRIAPSRRHGPDSTFEASKDM